MDDRGWQYGVKPKQEIPLWLRAFNHNMLRATRVIKSLRLCGLNQEAAAFFKCLEGFQNRVSGNTFEYWRAAAQDPLWQLNENPSCCRQQILPCERTNMEVCSIKKRFPKC